MRKRTTISVLIILVLAITATSFGYLKQSGELKQQQSQITELISEVSSLQNQNPQAIAYDSADSSLPLGDLLLKIQPVIVKIDTAGPGFKASASGVVIRTDGYILTNAHSIDNAQSIVITLSDGRRYDAAVINRDVTIDLALLKPLGGPNPVLAAVPGSFSDITVGQEVIAAGFPLGLELLGPYLTPRA